MRLTIRWNDDKNQTREEMITDQTTTQIGRSRESQIQLKDRRISRRHATISAKKGQWYLRNISSKNVVRKGGHRVAPGSEVALRQGDIFQIGPIRFQAAAMNDGAKQGRRVAKLQCPRCNHIVPYEVHEFCPWCGLSFNAAQTIIVSE
ncbi:MAG: FHA domain-containing protein [Ardenticatenaceae bacterium]